MLRDHLKITPCCFWSLFAACHLMKSVSDSVLTSSHVLLLCHECESCRGYGETCFFLCKVIWQIQFLYYLEVIYG